MEDFVPYKLAVKLKEKEFNELCLAYYTNDETLYYNYSHKAGASYTDCYLSHNLMPKDSVSGKFVDAPTISQVLKWLREEKKIYICIDIYTDGWLFDISTCEKEDELFSTEFLFMSRSETISYPSYEECALEGIKYVLDNFIWT